MSENWFCEYPTPGSGFQFRYTEALARERSAFQKIEVFRSEDFGIVLCLDDAVMVTERNEFAYHEMIIHVPMLTHPNPKRVLVVGGGDAGALREIVKHSSVEKAVQVEIDQKVVDMCRKYYGWVNPTYDNPKVELIIGDAIEYVKTTNERFDVVIVDSSDPIGPAEGLFREPFYRDVHRILTDDGIVSSQLGSPFWHHPQIGKLISMYRKIFPIAHLYTTYTPEYPSGMWGLGIASKRVDPALRAPAVFPRQSNAKKGAAPLPPNIERYRELAPRLKYYNPQVHTAAFILPEYVRKSIDG